jgi:hypothetical protein
VTGFEGRSSSVLEVRPLLRASSEDMTESLRFVDFLGRDEKPVVQKGL